jgi:hypothetical protein
VTTGTARPSTQPIFRRRDIARQPQQAVAGGAVALCRDHGLCDRCDIFRREAVPDKDPDYEMVSSSMLTICGIGL